MTEQADHNANTSGHPVETPGASANEVQGTKRARASKSRTNDPNRTIEKLSFTIDVNGDLGFLWNLNESYPGMRATELRRLLRMGIAAEQAGMQTSRMAGAIDAKPEDLQVRFPSAQVGNYQQATAFSQARESAIPAPLSQVDIKVYPAEPKIHANTSLPQAQSAELTEKNLPSATDAQSTIGTQMMSNSNAQKIPEKNKVSTGRAGGNTALGFLG